MCPYRRHCMLIPLTSRYTLTDHRSLSYQEMRMCRSLARILSVRSRYPKPIFSSSCDYTDISYQPQLQPGLSVANHYGTLPKFP